MPSPTSKCRTPRASNCRSESAARAANAQPLARVVAYASHAHAPEWFTTAPAGAIRRVLEKAGWSAAAVDLYEINEAFAVVTMAAMRDVGLDHARVNVNGGACALGHPIGATGGRILANLLREMKRRDVKYGLETMCIGGGQGIAAVFEAA